MLVAPLFEQFDGRGCPPASPRGKLLVEHDRTLGVRYVCGADEAGRACIAGPLVAAAVRFDYDRLTPAGLERLYALDDSKKLTPARRAALYPLVLQLADAAAIIVIPPSVIDRDGLHRSNMRGLAQTLGRVAMPGSENLADGFALNDTALVHRHVVRGDQTSAAIAAASIVAKETRDRLMRRLDKIHPGYHFADHKGYNTKAHEEAVVERGPSPQHRRSFRCKAFGAHAARRAA